MNEIEKKVTEDNQIRKILLIIENAENLDDAIAKVKALLER